MKWTYPLPLFLLSACASTQKYTDGRLTPCPSTNTPPGSQYLGLSLLLYLGSALLAFGVLSIAAFFWPLTRSFVSLKGAVGCILVGLLTIALYNTVQTHVWVLYVALAVAGLTAGLTYWPGLVRMWVKIFELFARRDLDKDGHVGPDATTAIPPVFQRRTTDVGSNYDPSLD